MPISVEGRHMEATGRRPHYCGAYVVRRATWGDVWELVDRATGRWEAFDIDGGVLVAEARERQAARVRGAR